jgi:hypothetical protein
MVHKNDKGLSTKVEAEKSLTATDIV